MSMLPMTPKIGNRRDTGLLDFHGLLTCLKKSLRKGNEDADINQGRCFLYRSRRYVFQVFFFKMKRFLSNLYCNSYILQIIFEFKHISLMTLLFTF